MAIQWICLLKSQETLCLSSDYVFYSLFSAEHEQSQVYLGNSWEARSQDIVSGMLCYLLFDSSFHLWHLYVFLLLMTRGLHTTMDLYTPSSSVQYVLFYGCLVDFHAFRSGSLGVPHSSRHIYKHNAHVSCVFENNLIGMYSSDPDMQCLVALCDWAMFLGGPSVFCSFIHISLAFLSHYDTIERSSMRTALQRTNFSPIPMD